ncbi:MAG: hypothetical protein P4L81_02885 [Candidatus Pacebacteria bacterium]|nr:hypothetical protein [Candidatus Paceibacterota bacterium]
MSLINVEVTDVQTINSIFVPTFSELFGILVNVYTIDNFIRTDRDFDLIGGSDFLSAPRSHSQELEGALSNG